jgi:hypothetical protein
MKKINKDVVYVTFEDFYPNVQEKLETRKITITEIDLCDLSDETLRSNEDIIIIAEIGVEQKLLSKSLQFAFNVY